MRTSFFFILLSLVAGCGGGTSSPDASQGTDAASPTDAFTATDAPMSVDAFVPHDAASPDAPIEHDTGTDAGRSDGGASGCVGCTVDQICAYAIADACSATGTCVTMPVGSPCGAIVLEQGCGCDGSAVTWHGGCRPQLPDGYAPAPISHMGMCP